MVVEDDVPLREAIDIKLRKEGFRVVVAGDGEQAINLLSSIRPDYIWLDMLLPGMSGLQFLEYLRSSEINKDVPVLIVSASSGPDKIKKAFELNIVNYVTKIDHPIKEIVDNIRTYFVDNNK